MQLFCINAQYWASGTHLALAPIQVESPAGIRPQEEGGPGPQGWPSHEQRSPVALLIAYVYAKQLVEMFQPVLPLQGHLTRAAPRVVKMLGGAIWGPAGVLPTGPVRGRTPMSCVLSGQSYPRSVQPPHVGGSSGFSMRAWSRR